MPTIIDVKVGAWWEQLAAVPMGATIYIEAASNQAEVAQFLNAAPSTARS